jgi:hypothetical protein
MRPALAVTAEACRVAQKSRKAAAAAAFFDLLETQ